MKKNGLLRVVSLLSALALVLALMPALGARASTTFVQPEPQKDHYTLNGHEYELDAVAGPTREVPIEKGAVPMNYDEKLALMHWSGRPQVGKVEGEYFHKEYMFNDGYMALIDAVRQDGKIVMVEIDEIASHDYYARRWAGQAKRLSGYGFFQVESQRTDRTMITLINTMTYLEHQMVAENRLSGDFRTVLGSSNSANKGFIPAAHELALKMEEGPSNKYYRAITRDFGGGLFARLTVITQRDELSVVKYDEYFADTQEEIDDAQSKQFFRQSKYYSNDYNWVTGKDFKHFADDISMATIAKKSLTDLPADITGNEAFQGELTRYLELAAEMNEWMGK